MRDRAWNPYTPMSPPRYVFYTDMHVYFLFVFNIHISETVVVYVSGIAGKMETQDHGEQIHCIR